MGQGASNIGKKIREGFDWLGGKIKDGWESAKAFGKRTWESIKSVPVLGKIAEGVEKYTPIGWAASNILRGIDTGVGATSNLLKGDVKGAIGSVTSGVRDTLNQKNPLLEEIKKVPVLGSLARAGESIVSRVPVFAGMSLNDIRSVGNAAANSVDALASGDIKGALREGGGAALKVLSSKGGTAGNVAKAITTGQSILQTSQA
jgi:hypothetical protein